MLGLQNTGWMDIGLAIRTFSGGWADGGGIVLRILPSSWAVVAVDAAGKGNWGVVALSLGGLAVLGAVLFFVFSALLSRQLVRGLSDGGTTQTGGDSLATKRILPGGPFGGVLGKELRLWVRDLRRARFLSIALWAGLFSGLFPLLDGNTVLLPFAGVITALFAGCAVGERLRPRRGRVVADAGRPGGRTRRRPRPAGRVAAAGRGPGARADRAADAGQRAGLGVAVGAGRAAA